jgi:hypothetical protein
LQRWSLPMGEVGPLPTSRTILDGLGSGRALVRGGQTATDPNRYSDEV